MGMFDTAPPYPNDPGLPPGYDPTQPQDPLLAALIAQRGGAVTPGMLGNLPPSPAANDDLARQQEYLDRAIQASRQNNVLDTVIGAEHPATLPQLFDPTAPQPEPHVLPDSIFAPMAGAAKMARGTYDSGKAAYNLLTGGVSGEIDPHDMPDAALNFATWMTGLGAAPGGAVDRNVMGAGGARPAAKAASEADAAMAEVPGSGRLPHDPAPYQPSITAYHGSPHDFDKFDISKIGTGEGAQAYGHGLYFAGNEGVARSYRDALAGGQMPSLHVDPSVSPDLASKIADMQQTMRYTTPQQFEAHPGFDFVSDADHAAFNEAIKSGKVKLSDNPGKMYQVQINADPEHFLDWGKPLSEQPAVQSKLSANLQSAMQKYGEQTKADWGDLGTENLPSDFATGAVLHKHLTGSLGNDPAAATQALRDAGIPGIKYLDAGSRAVGSKTSTQDIAVSILDAVGGNREKAIKEAQGRLDSLPNVPEQYRADPKPMIDTLNLLKSDWKDPRSHNYVTFSDDIISILKKYGLAGLGIGAGASMGGLGTPPPSQ